MAALLHAENYALGPDSQPRNGVPKGVVTKHTLAPGKFYPGTPHKYALYVPAPIRRRKTRAVHDLPGWQRIARTTMQRVPVVLDNLIAKHDLPPLIGIFVDPGVLPTVSGQAQNRFERVFEYDSLSDRYSRFLLEELIPTSQRNTTCQKIRTTTRSRASAPER